MYIDISKERDRMYYIYIHIQQYLEPQVQLPFNVNVMALLFRSRSGELSLCCLQAVSHAFGIRPCYVFFSGRATEAPGCRVMNRAGAYSQGLELTLVANASFTFQIHTHVASAIYYPQILMNQRP